MIPPGQLSPSWDQVMDHVQPFLVSPQGTTSRCAVEPCQAAAPWLSHGNWPYGHRVTSEPGPAAGEVVKPTLSPASRVWPCSNVLRPQSHPNFLPGAALGDAGLRLRWSVLGPCQGLTIITESQNIMSMKGSTKKLSPTPASAQDNPKMILHQ